MTVDSKNESLKRLSIRDKISQSIKVFNLIRKGYKIDINYDEVPNNLLTSNVYEAELYAILINLLSNSIKSVIAKGKDRKIKFSAEKDGKTIKLRIYDTGVGLDPEKDEDIFIPFISDPRDELYSKLAKKLNAEDKYIVGTGSGLGLSILRDLLEERNGSIIVLPPNDKWKAIIEVTI